MFHMGSHKARFLLFLFAALLGWISEPALSGHQQASFFVGEVWAADAEQDPEDAALALFQEAKTFFEKGDFKGALLRLQQAWGLFKEPVIALQLAEVHEKLGSPEEALAALQELDKVKIQDSELRVKVDVRKTSLMNVLKQPLGVSVISDVSTSQVIIDEGETRYPPFDIQLPRGKHVLRASAVGYRSSEQEIDVRGSVPMQVRFSLQPLTGTLAIRSAQESLANVKIIVDGLEWTLGDGERTQKLTRPRTAKVGKHQVVCWHEGQTKDIQTVSIREGEDLVVECRSGLVQRGQVNRAWGSVTLGAAIGCAAAGSYLLYAWNEDMEKAEREDLNIETNKHIFGGAFLALAAGSGIASYYFYQRSSGGQAKKSEAFGSVVEPNWLLTLVPMEDSLGLGAWLRF